MFDDVDGCIFSPKFSQIFSGGYAAGYYSYKWAEVLDADAFSLFLKNGLFDKATSDSFRRNVLMKGGINTDRLLRPVLNKEHGLLPPGQVLSHITLTKVPAYSKMLLFADAAVIPAPNDEQFRAMLRYTIDTEHALGNPCPRVALIHFTEKVNQKFEYTLTYADLIKEAA